MKKFILLLAMSLFSVGAFANVDASDDPNHPGMKLIVFTGNLGSAAEALYSHLTAATQSVDNSVENVVNTYRTGTALNCEKTEQDGQPTVFTCSTDVTSNGVFQNNE